MKKNAYNVPSAEFIIWVSSKEFITFSPDLDDDDSVDIPVTDEGDF